MNFRHFQALFNATPAPCLIVTPDAPRFTITEVNDAYCRATRSARADLLGKGIFEAFPENSGDPSGQGVSNLRSSLERVVASGTEHRMAIQKYDIPDRGSSGFRVRYWSPVNYPVAGGNGNLLYIMHTVTDVTDQLVTQNKEQSTRRELIENQEQYRYLFQHNPMPMWVYDARTYRFLEVNQAAVEKYGYSREEFLAMTIEDIRPEEDLERLRWSASFRSAPAASYAEYWRHVKKNGEVLHVDVTSHRIDYDRSPAILILSQDVTAKVNAEEAIRKSEEVRTLIMNVALDAIICMDPSGRVTLWNDQAEKIFGWQRSEVLGNKLSDYIIPDARRGRYEAWLRQYMKGSSGDFTNGVVEEIAVDRKGIEFPVELAVVHIRQGDAGFLCAYIRDITERQHHLTALDRNEKRYRTLVREGTDLIHIMNEKGDYQYVSPTYHAQLGYTGEELKGCNAFSLIHEDDRRQVLEAFLRLKVEKRVKTGPYRFRDSYDNYRWLESVGTSLMTDPSINGILVNSKDITERMDYIRAIEEQNSNLRKIAWMQSHVVRAPLSRIMGIVNVISSYPDIDSRTLLDSLLSSAHELDEQVRRIVKSTEQMESGRPDKETRK